MRRASHALAAYLVVALAATWPLVLGLGRDVPWDLGDSVLNMWILAWDCEQIRAILTGDLSRVGSFFDANIFHPAPVTLAYSEHLVAQAIQIFPVYLISGNPILSYNVLFLSTFVLSGLGMYLLVRELTGNAIAAFVAGLVFAFVPYRLPQSSHLQVLSSQWMPFVLYGLRRYFDTRRIRPLAGAAVALVAQNLSCGYYLLYFSPFVAAFALWEICWRRLWREGTVWLQLASAGIVTAAVTAPFVLPYAQVRSDFGVGRSRAEVTRFSADVYSYATAFPEQWIWGDVLQVVPKPEGELFPGLVPMLLGLLGIASGLRQARLAQEGRGFAPRRRALVVLCAAVALVYSAAAVAAVLVRRLTIDVGLFTISMTNVTRLLVGAAVAVSVWLMLSPPGRARVAGFMRDRGFFALSLLAAAWLSLGVMPRSLGRPLDIAAPYALLFDYVPGFDGLRVPARFAMIVMCMLAVLAGFGAIALLHRRGARIALGVMCLAFLLEATQVPFTVNGMTPLRDLNTPEARLYRPARAPAVYREVARQAPTGVLVELPLGNPDYDLRAMYYTTVHWRPLLNGYSGFFPRHYGQLRAAVSDLPRHPEISLEVLQATGATHAIVHEGAFLGDEGPATSAALRQLGAGELFRDGTDVLLALPAAR